MLRMYRDLQDEKMRKWSKQKQNYNALLLTKRIEVNLRKETVDQNLEIIFYKKHDKINFENESGLNEICLTQYIDKNLKWDFYPIFANGTKRLYITGSPMNIYKIFF